MKGNAFDSIVAYVHFHFCVYNIIKTSIYVYVQQFAHCFPMFMITKFSKIIVILLHALLFYPFAQQQLQMTMMFSVTILQTYTLEPVIRRESFFLSFPFLSIHHSRFVNSFPYSGVWWLTPMLSALMCIDIFIFAYFFFFCKSISYLNGQTAIV